MKSLDLIAKYLSGNLSDEEEKDFRNWLQQPNNKELLAEYETLWKSSDSLNQVFEVDTDAEWDKFKMKIASGSAPVKDPVHRFYRFRTAAVITMLVAAGTALTYYFSREIVLPLATQSAEPVVKPEFTSITADDTARVIYLPDSTEVILNRNTRLSYLQPFGKKQRTTYLEGEAFFDVRKDGTPFVVFAGGAEIRVIGTAFNVRTDQNEVQVSVLEGSVTFREQGATESSGILLEENQQVTFSRDGKQITRSPAGKNSDWWNRIHEPVKLKWHEIDLKQEIDDWKDRLKDRRFKTKRETESD